MARGKRYDAVIIGGGHNGLVNAAYLARADKRVLVLERRHVLGGSAVTEEFFPGFKFSTLSYVVSLLRPEIIRDLDLPSHGLEILPLESTLTPLPNGDYLARWADHDRTRREIYRHSATDAEAYDDFGRLMYQLAFAMKPLLGMVPPDPTSLSPRELYRLVKLGKHFRDLGRERFYALYKLLTMSSADYLDEWFETEPLKATMACSGIIGTFLGVRSPGTAYVLLHHYMGEIDGAFRSWGFARGGTGAVSQAIADAARRYGAEIRTESPVAAVKVKNGRATGVALESGEEIDARVVVSAVDPKLTFLKLVDPGQLPIDFVEAIHRFRIRGSSGKVNLALDALPNFTCLPGDGPHLRGAISISPSIDYLERAYDDAKYGEFSRRPYMDIVIPSMIDPTMAPPGKHVMSIFVQYAPYDLNGGWNEKRRDAFGDAVIDTLSDFAPNLKNVILHRKVITPLDMEQEYGLTDGNIFHGELALHQLFFMRPVPSWADYRTPIKDYYQCGSGTHPGGGITGASGRLSAQVILKDW
ncbi:MAG: NAD(P)/FAD-dependent oxidoreductase [Gemmatimonadetes bacterium]|uniref:Pyridine nucleotide-disulfide oxidoreductase domain-containing protein 2 n=1 Tax=Candidatus Kutchimonas denitrificans TaxID=3056748 RepID=A0AAE5C9T2_9BACT|nr:NAD(P)/FAD-dependent oxidoreductase [Gemmatimonadota bacterium]NIR75811.1 NAD(P)/FAD-dependent oxidoreductase [Candidatus Kutchimonas denitrificans]NIS01979.1 NAD(P)/FAD-dependent oxidoreductase [Gemmatimonadota bacterium]NIT67783.1 NAD(P)/FAD-dependent oxidoreductase [Gemmatimonadota bacterium]NIU53770.1 NAD(P)-binding protein [Gemmatimonadota bacterium]